MLSMVTKLFMTLVGNHWKVAVVFFVKEGLKYKQRTEMSLEMSFEDENNEFSFTG